jgi:hypothetical protein
MLGRPGADLVLVHEDAALLDPMAEFVQDIVVRIGRDARAKVVVPAVHATDQILAAKLTVRVECPAV